MSNKRNASLRRLAKIENKKKSIVSWLDRNGCSVNTDASPQEIIKKSYAVLGRAEPNPKTSIASLSAFFGNIVKYAEIPVPKSRAKLARQSKKRAFYAGADWQRLRYEALVRDGGKCLCCGRSPPEVVLHVDHIKPRAKYQHLSLDLNNLQVLCGDCNMGKSAWDQTDWHKTP